jgi:ArsR family transcriptional regulator, cadmium/lead-responsive transcriptional repressor
MAILSAVTDARRGLFVKLALGTDIGLVAKLLRGFADPTRLAILVALSDGEQRVTDLVARLGGSQGNISGHLACLKDCGMVTDRPEGRAVWYSIAEPEVIAVIRAAEDLLARTGQRVDLCPHDQAPDARRP